MGSLPLVDFAPDQLPDATQLVASVDDQVKALAPPLATLEGFAVMVTVGRGATATFALAAAMPPAPLHVNVNTALSVMGGVICSPLVSRAPDQLPEAMQLEALVDDHDNIAVAPLTTVPGAAVMVTVGAAGVGVGVGIGIGAAGGPDETADDGLPPASPPLHALNRTADSNAATAGRSAK